MKKAEKKFDHNFEVYKKAELLDRWNLKHNRRTGPIIILANLGYGFEDLREKAEIYKKNNKFNGKLKVLQWYMLIKDVKKDINFVLFSK